MRFSPVEGLEGCGGAGAGGRPPVGVAAAGDLVRDLAHEEALRERGRDGLGGALAAAGGGVERFCGTVKRNGNEWGVRRKEIG